MTRVVPAEATVDAALELAGRIAAMPPLAVRAAKAAILDADERSLTRRPRPRTRRVLQTVRHRRTRPRGWPPSPRSARPSGPVADPEQRKEEDAMERDPHGGSDVGRDVERDLGDEPAPAYPRRRARLPRPDRRVRRRSAATRRRPNRPRPAVGRPRARLGARPRPDLPGLPTGRHAGPGTSTRSIARRWRRTPRRAMPSRCSTSGPGRPAGRLHDRRRRLRHRRQRRPPAVVGRRADRDPGRGDAQPRRLVGDARHGPTRSRATAGSSAPTPGRRLGRGPDPPAGGRRPPRRRARRRPVGSSSASRSGTC